jgi:hypothetical protein
MADKSTIKIKRSSTSIAPQLLNTGELAYTFGTGSIANMGGRLFVGGMGANSDLQSAAGAPIVIGGKYFTDIIDAATDVGTAGTLVKRDTLNTAYLNIMGNVTGNLTGNSTGLHTGNVTGNLTGNSAGIHTGNVVGDIYAADGTSKILENGTDGTNAVFYGSVSGGITGDVTGNVTGNLTGNVYGDIFAADGITKVIENGTNGTNATFTGGVTGNLTGNVNGNLLGTVTGDIFASNGTSKILENGTDGTNAVFTGSVTGNVTGNLTGNVTGNLTGDSTGTHTGAVVGNADTASKWASPINVTLSGDVSAPAISIDGSTNKTATLTLATVLDGTTGKVPGSFGSATAIPVVSVNAKGLVTGITTANVATSLSFRADDANTTGTLNLLTDNLRIVGAGGVTTTIDDSTNTITVAMAGTGTLGALAVTGNVAAGTITIAGALDAGSATVSDITVNGNATITGDLSVLGTVTTINSTTVSIGDLNIELAKDATSAGDANGGGITINGPTIPASLTYSSSDNRWNFNKALNVSQVYGDVVGNADTATKWYSSINLNVTGDATAAFTNVDGAANKSAALTLATVNTNVGSYGDTLTVPRITVNAKGLITAVANQTIPTASTTAKGLAYFDSETFGVNASTGYVTLATVDGGTY